MALCLDALHDDEPNDVLECPRPFEVDASRRRTRSARETLRMERTQRGLADDEPRQSIVDWQCANTCAALPGD